jgi:hypothetical protein
MPLPCFSWRGTYRRVTFSACSPLCPCLTSNSTGAPFLAKCRFFSRHGQAQSFQPPAKGIKSKSEAYDKTNHLSAKHRVGFRRAALVPGPGSARTTASRRPGQRCRAGLLHTVPCALSLVSGAGHTHDDWVTVVHMMVNAGANLEKSQIPQIADYLTANFPEKPLPPAVIVPGSVKVDFKEWTVPTLVSCRT